MKYVTKVRLKYALPKILRGLLLVGLGILLGRSLAHALPQKPTGYVTDEANVLPQDTRKALESSISQFEKATTVEIAVVTVQSLGGLSVEEYANKLFRAWGIGKKGKDNGVLLLVSKGDRKIRIEVGYGLESKLNDSAAGDIIRNQLVPALKQGRYDTGIVNAVIEIERRVK